MRLSSLALTALAVALPATMNSTSRPKALIYRGPAACDGCPESVGHLLRTSTSNFEVTYVGPKEKVDITAESLKGADVFVQPGGGGVDENYPHIKPYKHLIRDFVSNGGRYMGFCLGAYFAGRPGYDLLPDHSNTNEEVDESNAQVTNYQNTVIQVNWKFHTGDYAGTTKDDQWLFFQDGAVILLSDQGATANGASVLARYSANGNIAASVTPFGKGWVGIVGPHPEADRSWYTHGNKNPDGYNLTIGHDFAETVYTWGT